MLGLRHGEIQHLLKTSDDIIRSTQILRWILKSTGLYKSSDPLEAASLMYDQLEGHRRLYEYELHHLNYMQVGYVVTQMITLYLDKFNILTWYTLHYT